MAGRMARWMGVWVGKQQAGWLAERGKVHGQLAGCLAVLEARASTQAKGTARQLQSRVSARVRVKRYLAPAPPIMSPARFAFTLQLGQEEC